MADSAAVELANMPSIHQFVSQSRLWALLMDLAQIGGTPAGGVNRAAFSDEDARAKMLIADWARKYGYAVYQDEIANLFIRRDGTSSELDPVLLGSHLDSQPTGGRFDGAVGVAAGLEVLRALDDANITTRRPVEVVAWSNEEGSRFAPGAMGSSIFARRRSIEELAGITDSAGTLLAEAVKRTIDSVNATFRNSGDVRAHAYMEVHIEQGPILESEEVPIGVVTGVQGIRRFVVEIIGEEGHAGTVPMRSRKNAFSSALAIATALEEIADEPSDTVRLTIGKFEVFPGSPNTIPGRVRFSIDLRHPVHAVLDRIGGEIRDAVATKSGPCTATVTEISYIKPTIFRQSIVECVSAAAHRCGFATRQLNSGAGHDAMHLAAVCPSGLIFIPCWRGISHNEKESATPQDVAAGAKVLAEVALELAAS